ncbi:MAG: hypothetical protein GX250_03300 [Clostridiales bacterium]|nr:hypothetical protein [Clostridiales bacterium]
MKMIRAIVYESNTGFTKKYAELLSAQTGLPCYSLSENKVNGGDSIIYLGWLCAGKIKGYAKASKNFNIRAVAGVGLRGQDAEALSQLIEQNNTGATPAFYLQGGVDIQRLRGLNKIILKAAVKAMAGKDGNPESKDTLYSYKDYVSPDNLRGLLSWYKSAV